MHRDVGSVEKRCIPPERSDMSSQQPVTDWSFVPRPSSLSGTYHCLPDLGIGAPLIYQTEVELRLDDEMYDRCRPPTWPSAADAKRDRLNSHRPVLPRNLDLGAGK